MCEEACSCEAKDPTFEGDDLEVNSEDEDALVCIFFVVFEILLRLLVVVIKLYCFVLVWLK